MFRNIGLTFLHASTYTNNVIKFIKFNEMTKDILVHGIYYYSTWYIQTYISYRILPTEIRIKFMQQVLIFWYEREKEFCDL